MDRVATLDKLTSATGMRAASLTVAAHQAIPRLYRRRVLLTAIIGIVLLVILAAVVNSGVVPVSLAWPFALAWIGAILLVAVDVQRREYEGLKQVLRQRRICFGCAYSLEGLHPEADGCVTCPECSAAWRLEKGEDSGD